MSKFEYLKKTEVKDKIVDYPLTNIVFERKVVDGDDSYTEEFWPILKVKMATNSNKKYINKFLKKASTAHQKAIGSGQVDEDRLYKQMEIDRAIYPGTVVVGWEDVVTNEGTQEPFSVAGCTEFLSILPIEHFEKLMLFCVNPSNFAESMGNVDDLAKN